MASTWLLQAVAKLKTCASSSTLVELLNVLQFCGHWARSSRDRPQSHLREHDLNKNE